MSRNHVLEHQEQEVFKNAVGSYDCFTHCYEFGNVSIIDAESVSAAQSPRDTVGDFAMIPWAEATKKIFTFTLVRS